MTKLSDADDLHKYACDAESGPFLSAMCFLLAETQTLCSQKLADHARYDFLLLPTTKRKRNLRLMNRKFRFLNRKFRLFNRNLRFCFVFIGRIQ